MSLPHGTTFSTSARKRSLLVAFFFPAYSLAEKLSWLFSPSIYRNPSILHNITSQVVPI